MPNYLYECECGYSGEIYQSIKDKPKKKCPDCRKNSLYRVITGGSDTIIRMEPKTVYHLGRRNDENMGTYERQAVKKQFKDRRKKARRELEKNLPPGASFRNKIEDD